MIDLEKRIRMLFKKAESSFQEGRYDIARQSLHEIIKLTGKDSHLAEYSYGAFQSLAQTYSNENKFKKAIEYYVKIPLSILEKSFAVEISLAMAHCYLELNDYKRALKCYRKGLRWYEGSDQCLIMSNLASAYIGLKKYRKAILTIEKALKLNPRGGHVDYLIFKLGTCNYFIKNYATAEEYLEKYLQEYSTNNKWIAQSHYYLAHIYYLGKAYQKSIDEYNSYLEHDASGLTPSVHLNMATNYYFLKKYAYAIKEAQKALSLKSNLKFADYAMKLIADCAIRMEMSDLYNEYRCKLETQYPKSKYLRELKVRFWAENNSDWYS